LRKDEAETLLAGSYLSARRIGTHLLALEPSGDVFPSAFKLPRLEVTADLAWSLIAVCTAISSQAAAVLVN
jgi:hypothetical protein